MKIIPKCLTGVFTSLRLLCVIFKHCESAVQNIQQESLFNENVKTSLSLLRPLVHN